VAVPRTCTRCRHVSTSTVVYARSRPKGLGERMATLDLEIIEVSTSRVTDLALCYGASRENNTGVHGKGSRCGLAVTALGLCEPQEAWYFCGFISHLDRRVTRTRQSSGLFEDCPGPAVVAVQAGELTRAAGGWGLDCCCFLLLRVCAPGHRACSAWPHQWPRPVRCSGRRPLRWHNKCHGNTHAIIHDAATSGRRRAGASGGARIRQHSSIRCGAREGTRLFGL
jgi:hypothetical protein